MEENMMVLAMQTNTDLSYYEGCTLYELDARIQRFNAIMEKQKKAQQQK